MNSAYSGLLFGLLGAIVLVYLLIVINFQSWSDPFVIITALPAALAGIIWMLFATHTTLSVPALTGAIMCMGVATANSVLVISFAREKLNELGDATQAALEAGFVRLRPVLMTALAMVIGMLPMALGLGEGGEQNAPLGRAVIGGLIFATVSTLFFVPVVFSIIHRRSGEKPARRNPFRSNSCPSLIRISAAPCCAGFRWVGGAFVLLAVAIVAHGMVIRADAKRTPAAVERSAGCTDRGDRDAHQRSGSRESGLAGPPGSLHPCTHLRARPGLSQKLAARYRREGERRRRCWPKSIRPTSTSNSPRRAPT